MDYDNDKIGAVIQALLNEVRARNFGTTIAPRLRSGRGLVEPQVAENLHWLFAHDGKPPGSLHSPSLSPHARRERSPERTSSVKISGCSQAAKCPPFATLL